MKRQQIFSSRIITANNTKKNKRKWKFFLKRRTTKPAARQSHNKGRFADLPAKQSAMATDGDRIEKKTKFFPFFFFRKLIFCVSLLYYPRWQLTTMVTNGILADLISIMDVNFVYFVDKISVPSTKAVCIVHRRTGKNDKYGLSTKMV